MLWGDRSGRTKRAVGAAGLLILAGGRAITHTLPYFSVRKTINHVACLYGALFADL